MISNMNKIADGLYLGNLDAANNAMTLKKLGVTHILTVALGLQPLRATVSISHLMSRTSFGNVSRS